MGRIVTPDRVCATCQYWEQNDSGEVNELTMDTVIASLLRYQ